ncbi:hypothetical protein ACFVBP_27455, partial [Nocardioides sp. NPDC057764]|uniref:hypothetical protein n=1 Tax=Nocardioides sp. NPDC057764 TaxID=3346243 RepID=UPI00366EA3EF
MVELVETISHGTRDAPVVELVETISHGTRDAPVVELVETTRPVTVSSGLVWAADPFLRVFSIW